jgi:uncharacterized protein YecE (DUF72 family)
MGQIYIGTSGWHYPHWRSTFYPPELSTTRWLEYYSKHFSTVEINNSFYQLPGQDTFRQWYNTTPSGTADHPGFLFAVKASRFITHMKKLTDPQTSSAKFFDQIALLKEKLGPILFQLPPHWRPNLERLDQFLAALPAGYRYTFEFRDPSWLVLPVFNILERHNAALCIYNFNRRVSDKEITADFVYVRLHGPGGPYQGKYSHEELSEWAGDFASWSEQGRDVYCYFDNDTAGYAPQNARELIEHLACIPESKGGL